MKVLINIYLDQNLGDDLFLLALLERYPQTNFYLIISDEYKLNVEFDRYKNLNLIKSKNINLLKKLKFDMTLYIGGSIFKDLGLKGVRIYGYRYLNIFLFNLLKKPTVIIGCNLEKVKSSLNKVLIEKILRTTKFICVRDIFSLNYIKTIREDSFLGSDIIFSIKDKEEKLELKENVLGISLINKKTTNFYKENYIKKITQIIEEYLAQNSNFKVKLFCFDSGKENDKEVAQEILKKLNQNFIKRILVEEYSTDYKIKSYIKSFRLCNYIICGRFHSLILALKYQIPFFSINYSSKMLNILQDTKNEIEGITFEKVDNLRIEEVLLKIKKSEIKKLDKNYINSSHSHFIFLDKVLNKNEK